MDTKARLLFLCSLFAANLGFAQNIGFGTTQPQTIVDLNGDLAIRSTPLTLANGVLNAVDVTTPKFSSFRVTGPNAPFTIAGMVAGSEGKLVTLFNRSGQTMTVANEAGTANANARIITGTESGINIPNNASIQFQYDNTLFRWVVRSHSAPAGGVAVSGGWGLSGNAGLNNANFVGTTDGSPLTLKQNSATVGYFAGNNVLLGVGAGSGFASGNNNAFILGKMRSPLTTTQYSVAIGTDAEISGDYQIMIGAPVHKTGIGLGYNEAPDHTLTIGRRYGNAGALGIYGSGNFHTHFNYGNTEDTYIRGGKLLSKVYINDGNGGDVIIGSPSTSSVGIGTNLPQYKLHVLGQGHFYNANRISFTTGEQGGQYFGGGSLSVSSQNLDNYPAGIENNYLSFDGRNIQAFVRSMDDGSVSDYAGSVVLNPIDGNVGIGTNYAPNRKLEIYKGRILFTGAQDAANFVYGGIEFTNAAGNSLRGFVGMAGDDLIGFYGYTGGGFGLLMHVPTGNVSIGTVTGATGYKLSVGGKIMAEEIRVQSKASWPDYVFKPGYPLTPLSTLEKQINVLGHLPNMPDAGTIEKEGISLGDMQTRMMEKIEELTLYIIQVDKDNKLLKEEIKALKESRQSHAATRF